MLLGVDPEMRVQGSQAPVLGLQFEEPSSLSLSSHSWRDPISIHLQFYPTLPPNQLFLSQAWGPVMCTSGSVVNPWKDEAAKRI